MSDFDPVEIDFMYGGNTETEGAKIVKTTEEIAEAHSQATKMVERHNTTILELRKDLVSLGTAYKQATTKNQKSELLTEIELTKKNILDETAAIKVLKAEIASMNKLPKSVASAASPDAAQVGKAAVGYSSLTFSTQQLVRELPAATMGLNTFFLAISNNIPVLTDGIKRARAENEALKASGASTTPVWKQLLGSLVSWQSLMMVGITVFSMYGKDIAKWIGELMSGEKAVKKLTNAQLGLTSANQTMIDSLNSGSEFQTAVTNIEKLSTSLKDAKGNHELEKKAVDDYNGSLGETFGKAKNVDEALKLIAKNKDQYIKAMQDMSFANAFFAKSAEDAMKAMEIGMKSQQQILRDAGSDAKGMWEDLNEFDKQISIAQAEQKKGLNPNATVSIGGAFGTQYSLQGAIDERKRIAKEIVEIETNERKRQLESVGKHQDSSLKEAEKYYNSYTDIFKENDWNTPGKPDKKNRIKEVYDSEKAITDLILDVRARRTKLELDQQTDSLQKRLAAIEFEKNEEIRKIEEKEAAIVAAYNKNHKGDKGFVAKTTLAQIDPTKAGELSAEKDNITVAYTAKGVAETKKYGDEMTELMIKYAKERVQIEYDYNKSIEELAKNGFIVQAAELVTERDNRISSVTKDIMEETKLYKILSDDKLQISAETTARLIADLKAQIEAAVNASDITKRLSRKDADQMLADLNKVQKTISDQKNENNPFAQLSSAIKGSGAAQQAFKNAPIGTSTEELAKLEDAANKARQSMAGAAGSALQGVSSMLNSVVGGLDQLGMLTDEQKKDAENVIGMVDGAANIAMGIATGNPMAVIQGAVDLLVNALEYFDFKTKKLAKSQKEHLQNIEDLELKYKQLQRTVETALGTDVYKAQRTEIENQKKQIQEYEAWLTLEGQKKKKKQDAEKIAETKAKIDELKNSIEDEAKAIAEALAQTDAKSLANELADAITTAFMNGEDAALAFGDVAEQVMQNAVKNALKLQFLEKPMQNAVDQLSKDMESGDSLSDAEQAAFRKKIEDAGKVYYEQLAQYSDLFTGSADVSQTGIKGDVAKMTEETGSALVGQITAMRLNVAALLNNSKSSLDSIGKVLATLEAIRVNTAPIAEIKETLNYLKLNGIKVI